MTRMFISAPSLLLLRYPVYRVRLRLLTVSRDRAL